MVTIPNLQCSWHDLLQYRWLLWIPLLDTVLLQTPNQAINHSNIATSYHYYYYYYYIPKRRHCISSWVPSFQRKITETSNRDRILIQPILAVHTSESSIPSQDIILRSRARNQAKFRRGGRRVDYYYWDPTEGRRERSTAGLLTITARAVLRRLMTGILAGPLR